MVVILIIGIVSALAIPTFATMGSDHHAYNDAGSIMMLFRSARTRAVARGGAVLIAMSAKGASDRGTFMMYEAVSKNINDNGDARTPVASCASPTTWAPLPTGQNPTVITNATANTGVVLIDGVNLNLPGIETEADIETALSIYPSPTSSNAVPFTQGYICYTPLGRTYLLTNATTTIANVKFDGIPPTISPIEARVTRAGGATTRSVLVPPNGMARLFSHT
jgi:Tfp pilus assembly protein FimT